MADEEKKQFHIGCIDKKIMTYVMVVVLLIVIIAVTAAWYFMSQAAKVKNLSMTTASTDVIRVALRSGGDDVLTLSEQGKSITVDTNMPVFVNVPTYIQTDDKGKATTKNELAPGVYGQMNLYITPKKQSINAFRIAPSSILTYMDEEMSEEQKTTLEKLAKGHILFFQTRTEEAVDSKKVYHYSGLLTTEQPLTGTLEYDGEKDEGIEKKVTVFWYWPYEDEDVPEDAKNTLDDTNFFDPDRLAEMSVADSDVHYTDEQLYDYADTKIGTYIKSLKMHLKVDGYHE